MKAIGKTNDGMIIAEVMPQEWKALYALSKVFYDGGEEGDLWHYDSFGDGIRVVGNIEHPLEAVVTYVTSLSNANALVREATAIQAQLKEQGT
jgi:hypothetical protein